MKRIKISFSPIRPFQKGFNEVLKVKYVSNGKVCYTSVEGLTSMNDLERLELYNHTYNMLFNLDTFLIECGAKVCDTHPINVQYINGVINKLQKLHVDKDFIASIRELKNKF